MGQKLDLLVQRITQNPRNSFKGTNVEVFALLPPFCIAIVVLLELDREEEKVCDGAEKATVTVEPDAEG